MGRTGRITLPKHQKSKTHTQPLNIKNPFYTTGAIKPDLQPITGVLPIGVTNVEEAEKERELAKIAESYAATKFLPEKYQRLKDLQKAAIKKKEDAAMQLIIERMIEQKFEGGIPQPFKKDVLKYLGNLKKQYDLIHVLPPEALPPGTTDRFQELVDKGIIGTNLLTEIYKYLRSEGYSEPTGAEKLEPKNKNSHIYRIFSAAGTQFVDLSKKTLKLIKYLASSDDKKKPIPTMRELLKDKGDEISRMAQENKEANRQGQQQPDPNGPPDVESQNGSQGNVGMNNSGSSLLHGDQMAIPSRLPRRDEPARASVEEGDDENNGDVRISFEPNSPNSSLNPEPLNEQALRNSASNLGDQPISTNSRVEEISNSEMMNLMKDTILPSIMQDLFEQEALTNPALAEELVGKDYISTWLNKISSVANTWRQKPPNARRKSDLIRNILQVICIQNPNIYPRSGAIKNFLSRIDWSSNKIQNLQKKLIDEIPNSYGSGIITHVDGGGYSDEIPVKRLSYMVEPMRKYARIEEPETQVNDQQDALEKRENMYKDWQHKLYGVDPSTEKIQNAMPKTAEPFNPFTKSHSMILNNTSPLSVKRSAFPFLAFQKR